MRVRRSIRRSIVAQGNIPLQILARRRSIRRCLRRRVQLRIVMRMMMRPAHALVLALIISSRFVLPVLEELSFV